MFSSKTVFGAGKFQSSQIRNFIEISSTNTSVVTSVYVDTESITEIKNRNFATRFCSIEG